MVDGELQLLYDRLRKSTAEEVFGSLDGDADESLAKCKKIYQMLIKQTHPDRFMSDEDKRAADLAFKELQRLYGIIQNKIKSGTYGGKTESELHIVTKKTEYHIGRMVASGTISDAFAATAVGNPDDLLVKICRSPSNNDLMNNEMVRLKEVRKKEPDDKTKFLDLIAEPVDSFPLTDRNSVRNVNVFKYDKSLVSLEDVIKAYPKGIDQRDMAWMFKRSLGAIWWASTSGIVHGAPIPPHILLNLTNHGIVLVDWTQSAKIEAQRVKVIDPKYETYYPSALLNKKAATSSMDIYILAMTMIKLLGGDPKTKTIPDSVASSIRAILRSCILENAWDDAKFIHQEFDNLIKKLFGPPKWRDFSIPKAK